MLKTQPAVAEPGISDRDRQRNEVDQQQLSSVSSQDMNEGASASHPIRSFSPEVGNRHVRPRKTRVIKTCSFRCCCMLFSLWSIQGVKLRCSFYWFYSVWTLDPIDELLRSWGKLGMLVVKGLQISRLEADTVRYFVWNKQPRIDRFHEWKTYTKAGQAMKLFV